MNKLFALFALTTLSIACQQAPANQDDELREEISDKLGAIPALSSKRGDFLLRTQCYTCHNPAAPSHDDMLAPPMVGIKDRYRTHYPERDLFVQHLADFVRQPSKENAVMKGPVRRFGLMPPVALDPDTILALAAYIYDSQLPYPEWFPEHFEEQHGKTWEQ